MWFAYYYWWRLFPSTAFYVSLLIETINDLKLFLVFYIVIIFTFATMIMVLNQQYKNLQDDGEDFTALIVERSGHDLFDAFVMIWALGIGDYSLKQYNNKPSTLPYWIFILSTFFTNIVFLNMLINIMGDTLERMKEQRERVGLIQRTQLYADFIHHFSVDKKLNNHHYIYIINPEQSSQDIEDSSRDDYGLLKLNASLIKLERQNKIFQSKMIRKLYMLERQQTDHFHNLDEKLKKVDPVKKLKNNLHQITRQHTKLLISENAKPADLNNQEINQIQKQIKAKSLQKSLTLGANFENSPKAKSPLGQDAKTSFTAALLKKL